MGLLKKNFVKEYEAIEVGGEVLEVRLPTAFELRDMKEKSSQMNDVEFNDFVVEYYFNLIKKDDDDPEHFSYEQISKELPLKSINLICKAIDDLITGVNEEAKK